MNRKLNKKIIFLLFFSFIYIFNSYSQAQYNIDYYGIVSTEIDQNMSKMTSDLYYTQLCEINNFTVNDKRVSNSIENAPENSELSSDNLSFYAKISKKENSSKWISSFTLIDKKNNTKQTETKEYDSYYKILMEPKAVLQASIKNLIDKQEVTGNDSDFSSDFNLNKNTGLVSTEFLSGTWSGEDNIDKIVIMRGGRGFVIFTNGATMNINIELENAADSTKKIIITQSSRTNASFLIELPRAIALKEAVNAAPIKWTFSISNENTLVGIKNTLIESNGSAVPANLNVTWKRKS